MKFMAFMTLAGKAAQDYEHGRMPTQEEISAMMKYNGELAESGILLGGEGLHPTAKGIRIEFTAGEPHVSDGPFAESKELIGGYWIWKVDSREDALRWAKKCPMRDGDVLVLRQIFDM